MTSEALAKAIKSVRSLGSPTEKRDNDPPTEKAKTLAIQFLELIDKNHGELPHTIKESRVNGIYMAYHDSSGFVGIEIHNEDPDGDIDEEGNDRTRPSAVAMFVRRIPPRLPAPGCCYYIIRPTDTEVASFI